MRKLGVVMGVLALATATAAPAGAATPTFGLPSQVGPSPAFGIAVGLLDGNPFPDALLTPGSTGLTNVQVVLAKGDGTFFGPADVTGASQVDRPILGDIDGDGDTDAAITSTGGIILLTGNGIGGFTSAVVGPATFVSDIAFGDVTGDGRRDIVATPFGGTMTPSTLLVLRQNANGTFTSIDQTGGNAGSAGQGALSVALGDLDRDGRLDVVTGDSNGIVFTMPGDNTGVFKVTQRNPFSAFLQVDDLVLTDLNRNGTLDVATASAGDGAVHVLLGNGTTGPMALGTQATIPVGANAQWIATGDLDGDGIADLVASSYPGGGVGRVSILHGRGDGTFDPNVDIATPSMNTPGIALGDANLDDRPDLWIAPRDNPPQLRLNTTAFPPPSAVTGGATEITQTSASLNGAVDGDGRRGTFHFEYGTTTAYGSVTPEAPAFTSPVPQAVNAAITGLTPNTTYHFRLVATTLAGGPAAGADGTFTTPPVVPTSSDAIALARTTFNVRWKVSKPSGELVVRGTAREAGKVRIRLLRDLGKGRTRLLKTYSATIAAGDWTRRLKVPTALLPGKHVVILDGTVGSLPLVATNRALTLAAPPEGVVGQAFASSVRNGPPALRLPGKRTQAHANFVFSVRPRKGRPIVARWFLPSGVGLTGVPKANATRVGAVVSAAGGLPAGRWRCELRVKGVLVAVVRVRIG